jgi:very-short-patch-repair endonuclease
METINASTPFVLSNKAFFIDVQAKDVLSDDKRYVMNEKIQFCIWQRIKIKDEFIFGYVELTRRQTRKTAQAILDDVLLLPVSMSLSQKDRIALVSNEKYRVSGPYTIGKPREVTEHKEAKMSSGEQAVADLLNKYQTKYIRQFRPAGAPKHYRYDFFFQLPNGRKIVLEFDGVQHFQHVPFFNKTAKSFLRQQRYDIKKTKWAIANNYYIVRIDYTCINTLTSKLVEALTSDTKCYFSTPSIYSYIH